MKELLTILALTFVLLVAVTACSANNCGEEGYSKGLLFISNGDGSYVHK